MAFFLNFYFDARFKCVAFRLEMGQRAGLHKRFIISHQIPSFCAPKWHFFKDFRFGASFFICARIQIRTNLCSFSIEMGQRAGLQKRFIIFRPNSIVWPPKWHIFENFRFDARFILHKN